MRQNRQNRNGPTQKGGGVKSKGRMNHLKTDKAPGQTMGRLGADIQTARGRFQSASGRLKTKS